MDLAFLQYIADNFRLIYELLSVISSRTYSLDWFNAEILIIFAIASLFLWKPWSYYSVIPFVLYVSVGLDAPILFNHFMQMSRMIHIFSIDCFIEKWNASVRTQCSWHEACRKCSTNSWQQFRSHQMTHHECSSGRRKLHDNVLQPRQACN